MAILNIAHRGASGLFPENTLASFLAAAEAGANMCELDVQLTRDGTTAVIHDDTVDRTTNGKGLVSSFTLEEIQRLDAVSWRGSQFAGEQIPTLKHVVHAVAGRCGLNIELKAPGVERVVAEIIRTEPGDFIVSCFEWKALDAIRSIVPDVRIGLLGEEHPAGLIRAATEMRAHAVHPRYDMATADFCGEAHKAGLKVYVWTVDDAARMRTLCANGVDGIMTNWPDRLKQVLETDGAIRG